MIDSSFSHGCLCLALCTLTAGCGGSVVTAANDAGPSTTDGAADSAPTDATRPQDATSADAGPVDGTVPFDATNDANIRADAASDASTVCSLAEQMYRWEKMDVQPISLPYHAAGLDLVSPEAGILTLPQAEAILCQSVDGGDLFGDGRRVALWGAQQEVWLEYDPATLKANDILVIPGYTGTLQFHSPDGSSKYTIPVYTQILKNGQPFTLEAGWTGAAFDAEVDELYRGLIATFAPAVPLDPPGTTCVSTGKCVVAQFAPTAYFDVPALGFLFWVADFTAGPSFPNRIDVQ